MSVIAWDGRNLVGDTFSDYTGLQLKRVKVFQLNKYIWGGFAGCISDWWKVKAYLESGGPPPEGKLDFNAIIIRNSPQDEKPRVTYMADSIDEVPIVHPFFAIGAGGEVAMMAMHLGNSAITAVRAACDLHTQCAEPLTIFTVPEDDIPF